MMYATTAAVLMIAAAYLYRRRLGSKLDDEPTAMTDEMIQQLEKHGTVEIDEPLDSEEIRRAEERFWSETWEEPEEW